jgi:hypothetical protein
MSQSHPYKVGENYFIRTVTHHHTGRLMEVYDKEIVLKDASWIAVDGRFADVIASGNYEEIEPFPDGKDIIIGRGAIIDAFIIDHPLPRKQK